MKHGGVKENIFNGYLRADTLLQNKRSLRLAWYALPFQRKHVLSSDCGGQHKNGLLVTENSRLKCDINGHFNTTAVGSRRCWRHAFFGTKCRRWKLKQILKYYRKTEEDLVEKAVSNKATDLVWILSFLSCIAYEPYSGQLRMAELRWNELDWFFIGTLECFQLKFVSVMTQFWT